MVVLGEQPRAKKKVCLQLREIHYKDTGSEREASIVCLFDNKGEVRSTSLRALNGDALETTKRKTSTMHTILKIASERRLLGI